VNNDYTLLAVGELIDQTAEPTPAPGGGSLAALMVGLAAALVVAIARSSRDSWPEAAGVSAQAVELSERCPALARDDAIAWTNAFDVLRAAIEGTVGERDGELQRLLEKSADLPLQIAEIGADVATLAALAAKHGEPGLKADAVSAAMLAHAGARVGAHLVVVNLGTRHGDERSDRASIAEWRAGQAVTDALSVGT
jgi:formiminotetrahydrofolate cyclodeaminase